MDEGINITINRYISLLKKNHKGITKAILFGSYAKKNESLDSDIDIALIFDKLNDSDRFDLQVQLMLLASQIDSRIEPHPISKEDFYSNSPFVNEIKRTGVEIKA
ncbi:MAG: nucleotidyltransferase domain-containing protein [Tenuifilaceae bacterium]|jgi:predicted nucleotidyltransferase|nr:nucleotidyltransferase domain-containing protein [Bacteroidales bacterium]NLH57370.1 nucleotidyltransferase domain-containing protein [Rikenellaceae bacterium]OQC65313.1 MAG: Nucleotidyltransferase domain protein [Bacteroidetes bacterium ADurb.Bin008]HNV82549.1 nucleotidyltransferase domain-containing protein [Tenuifilaceae bacterium]HOF92522.1 nucleotidyltransferase domain-containing protein [Tenuifilaceae bacterium]